MQNHFYPEKTSVIGDVHHDGTSGFSSVMVIILFHPENWEHVANLLFEDDITAAHQFQQDMLKLHMDIIDNPEEFSENQYHKLVPKIVKICQDQKFIGYLKQLIGWLKEKKVNAIEDALETKDENSCLKTLLANSVISYPDYSDCNMRIDKRYDFDNFSLDDLNEFKSNDWQTYDDCVEYRLTELDLQFLLSSSFIKTPVINHDLGNNGNKKEAFVRKRKSNDDSFSFIDCINVRKKKINNVNAHSNKQTSWAYQNVEEINLLEYDAVIRPTESRYQPVLSVSTINNASLYLKYKKIAIKMIEKAEHQLTQETSNKDQIKLFQSRTKQKNWISEAWSMLNSMSYKDFIIHIQSKNDLVDKLHPLINVLDEISKNSGTKILFESLQASGISKEEQLEITQQIKNDRQGGCLIM